MADRNFEEIKAMSITKAIALNGLSAFPKNPFKIPLESVRNIAQMAMNIANTNSEGYSFTIEDMIDAVIRRGYTYKEVYTFPKESEALEPGEKEEMVSTSSSPEKVIAKAVPEKVEIPSPSPASPEEKEMIEIAPISSPESKGGAADVPEEGIPFFPVDLGPINYASIVEHLLKLTGSTIGKAVSDTLGKFNIKVDPVDIAIRAEPDLANRKAKFILEVTAKF